MISFFSFGEFKVNKFKFGDVNRVLFSEVCCWVFVNEKFSFRLFLLYMVFWEFDVVGIIFLLYNDVFIYEVGFGKNDMKISWFSV